MSENKDSKDFLRQLLVTQPLAVLTTLNNQQPYSNLVAFAVSDDLRQIAFATNRNTQKYRNIILNDKVSLLIDNRSSGTPELSEGLAVTALGIARELEREKDKNLLQSYLNKHSSLMDFLDKKDTAVINVQVTDYILARFDQAERIRLDSLA